MDFVSAIKEMDQSLPQKLACDLSRSFPVTEPVDAVTRHLQVTGKGVEQSEVRFKQWNFFGKEREKQLAIAPGFLFISYHKYTTFEDLQTHFTDTVGALLRAFPETIASRFGLRYINVIENINQTNPTLWNGIISPELLENRTFFGEREKLTRLMSVAELSYGDVNLKFQFGMPNPDYPAVIRRAQYVLDLDAYVQTAHSISESSKYMVEAHGYIQNFFEKSITETLGE